MGYIDRFAMKSAARDFIRFSRRPVLGASALYVVIVLLLCGVDGAYYLLSGGHSSVSFLSVLTSLMASVLAAGYTLFCMSVIRREETSYFQLFDGFSLAGKIIVLELLTTVKIFLWSLLFWIPGIVAMYRYRFALYNLLENPSLTVSQAIAISCVQTNGMKGQLFVLDLSFLGWELLSVATAGIALVFVVPYRVLTDLGYYEAGKRLMSPSPGSFYV